MTEVALRDVVFLVDISSGAVPDTAVRPATVMVTSFAQPTRKGPVNLFNADADAPYAGRGANMKINISVFQSIA